MTPKEKALDLCQKIGITTLFAPDCNGGVTLPKRVSKIIATIFVDEIIKVCPYISQEVCETVEQYRSPDNQFVSYWNEAKKEIELL